MAPRTRNNDRRGGGGSKTRGKSTDKTVTKNQGGRGRAKADTPGGKKDNRGRSKSAGPRKNSPKNNNKGKNGGRGAKKGRGRPKKQLTAEELDQQMVDYHLKGDNKEAASKKLDEDMDAYWDKKDKPKEAEGEEMEANEEPEEAKEVEAEEAATES